jgi:hypothetical protein
MLVPDMKDLPYDIFELTGQKLYELFDMIVNNPLISKLIQNKKVCIQPGRHPFNFFRKPFLG